MSKKPPRTSQTFYVGEEIIVASMIHRKLQGKRGVVCKVDESRYHRTLDRYTVHLDDDKQEVVLWDIELQRQT